ncbi:MAG: FemAB family PEP-CTERM system-associated protein [Candidatus Zixiibacteriota bacterium]|nr:MAG: FemAB family PEP-CTERM system-associated protein [candidate division Zixibacteria bacterium]
MISVSEYSTEHESQWSQFVSESDTATIAHEIGWRDVIADSLGHKPMYLMATRGSEITGILPLFLVTTWWRARYVVSSPWIDYGGVCARDPESESLLLERACQITQQHKARFMELRSVDNSGAGNLEISEKKVTFLLELNRDPDKIWKGFDAKLRNQVRKADKSGLTTEYAGVEKLDLFYGVFSYNMRDLGTPVWGRDFFERILTRFNETAKLILVRKEDRVIAGGLVLAFKNRLYVPSASSYRSYLKYCPNHALYWRVIKDACEQGYAYFDFGRSTWDSPTFRFKKQWAPQPRQLRWQYYLNSVNEIPSINPNNPKYRLFIGTWRKLPLRIANLLGPRVIKNFP